MAIRSVFRIFIGAVGCIKNKGLKSLNAFVVLAFTGKDILSKSILKVAVMTVVIALVESPLVFVSGSCALFFCVFPRSTVLFLTDVALTLRSGVTSIRAIPTVVMTSSIVPRVLVITVTIATVLVVAVIFTVCEVWLIRGGRIYFLLSYNR